MTAAERAATAAEPAGGGRATVLYDGECPLCNKSRELIERLDWTGAIRWQNAREANRLPPSPEPLDPARLLEEMHLITPDRRTVHHGFWAFRWMAWRLPLLTAFAPLLYVPGMPWLGQRIYLWVAKNRFKLVPCHQGVCHVEFPRS